MAPASKFFRSSDSATYTNYCPVSECIDKFSTETYGVALTAFITMLKIKGHIDVVKALPTFNTICDIALNPPLPPFFMCAPKDREHWLWSDIYPPLRFVRLVEAVQEVGYLSQIFQHDDIFTYINNLCQYLEWPNPNNYIHLFEQCKNVINFDNFYSDLELKQLLGFDYYHYLFWVQYKTLEERRKNLPIFTNPAQCRCSEELWDYYEDLFLKADIIDSYFKWVKAPMTWRIDTFGFGTPFRNFNGWLITNSCLHYFLFDLVGGVRSFDTSAYPSQMKELIVYDNVRSSLEHMLGIKLEKDLLKRTLIT